MSSPTPQKSPKGKEPLETGLYEHLFTAQEEPRLKSTTPPRIGFGVELEFLIAECDGEDPDLDQADQLPPLIPLGTAEARVQDLLESNGFPLHAPSRPHQGVIPSSVFVVQRDVTVTETQGPYTWADIEIATAASYATDEAFDLIHLLVSLITTNFRCRVNSTTGYHLHVSNGFERIEGRHARKYAALIWAAEPMLSMLHPPERAFARWSASIRRTNTSRLASGSTAEHARREITVDTGKVVGREYCRAREYGDLVAAEYVGERIGSDHRLWEEGNPDKVDWERPGFEPFERPQILGPRETIPIFGGPVFFNEGRKDIKAGPTTLYSVAEPTQPYTFERTGQRSDNNRPYESAYTDEQIDRMEPSGASCRHDAPEVGDAWSGIVELLSSDIGAHQVARLMYKTVLRPNYNFHHLGACGSTQTEPSWLPDEYIKPEYLPARHELARYRAEEECLDRHSVCYKHTVECREAAGSLDPEWIVTWAKINCGLLEFARDAEPSYFMSVLDKCAQATDYGAPYDVVDLLRDVGLFSEANHCEKRLARGEEAWFECMLLRKTADVRGPDEFGVFLDEDGEVVEDNGWGGIKGVRAATPASQRMSFE